jgi:hypothetical protein
MKRTKMKKVRMRKSMKMMISMRKKVMIERIRKRDNNIKIINFFIMTLLSTLYKIPGTVTNLVSGNFLKA